MIPVGSYFHTQTQYPKMHYSPAVSSGSGRGCKIDIPVVVNLSISEKRSMADICPAANDQYLILETSQ